MIILPLNKIWVSKQLQDEYKDYCIETLKVSKTSKVWTETLDKKMEANIINERTFVFTKEGNYACQIEGCPNKR